MPTNQTYGTCSPYINGDWSSCTDCVISSSKAISSNTRVGNQAQSQAHNVTWTRSIVHYDCVVDAAHWPTECWSSTHQ